MRIEARTLRSSRWLPPGTPAQRGGTRQDQMLCGNTNRTNDRLTRMRHGQVANSCLIRLLLTPQPCYDGQRSRRGGKCDGPPERISGKRPRASTLLRVRQVGPMPRDFLADAKRRLGEAYALLDARIDDLKRSDPQGSLRDRLVVARECVREALTKVEHAEEAITIGDDEARPPQTTPSLPQ